jgi:glycosyltransferase involved in cell wall biosynthesis
MVPLELKPGTFDPVDAARFSGDLAEAINRVVGDAALQERFGRAGRKRVEDHFSWTAIAHQTLDLYRSLLG